MHAPVGTELPNNAISIHKRTKGGEYKESGPVLAQWAPLGFRTPSSLTIFHCKYIYHNDMSSRAINNLIKSSASKEHRSRMTCTNKGPLENCYNASLDGFLVPTLVRDPVGRSEKCGRTDKHID